MPSSSLHRNLLSLPPPREGYIIVWFIAPWTFRPARDPRHPRKSRFICTRALDFQMRETSRDQLPFGAAHRKTWIYGSCFLPVVSFPRMTKVTRHFHTRVSTLTVYLRCVKDTYWSCFLRNANENKECLFVRKQRCTVIINNIKEDRNVGSCEILEN